MFTSGTAALCALSWHVHSQHGGGAGQGVEAGTTPAAREVPVEERLFQWVLETGGGELDAARLARLKRMRDHWRLAAAARERAEERAREEIAKALAAGSARDPALEAALETLARVRAERQRELTGLCFEIRDLLAPGRREDFLNWVDANLLHRRLSGHERPQ